MFKTTIVNPKRIIYEGDVRSVFMPGIEGEFEVLQLHKPMISLLKKGQIVINWELSVHITKGVMMVRDDELIALVEE